MDDGSILSSGLILLILLLLAAYFAACETAFASVSRAKLKTAQERGDRRADRALYVADRFDKAITTILIGTNIVHIAAAAYVTLLVTRRWSVSAVTVSTIVTTVVVFFAGEMLPKSLGKKYSERFALSSAGSLCFFMRVFTPVTALLTAFGNLVARLTPGDSGVSVTEEELYDIIENMTDEGELSSERGELVNAALDFGDTTVESIVTARVDLMALDVDDEPTEILETIKRCRHSRLPVYEDSIDNIIGILQIRKYIKAWLADREAVDIRSLLDRPYFIHQSTHIDELLPYMSSKKINMAVVTDNYGGTLGVVTVEDILEELVGEIWDEEDVVVEKLRRNSDGSFSFDADVDIEDAFAFMEYDDPEDADFEHKLLGEWAYEHFDLIPQEGQSFFYHNLKVTVEQVRKRRILTLRIDILPSEATEGGGET